MFYGNRSYIFVFWGDFVNIFFFYPTGESKILLFLFLLLMHLLIELTIGAPV